MESETKNKYELLNKMLGEGDVMVCLDARHPGVDVPKAHKQNPMLNLIFNLNFKRPFDVTEEGIFATLSFGGRPRKCVIPFPSIWAIYEPETQKGQVWETSIPEDINLENQIAESKKTASAEQPGFRPPKPPGEPAADKPKTGRDRSHLRVIK